MKSSSIFAQLTATRNGLGLCILPHFVAKQHPELQIVLAGEVELKRSYWMICHHDLRNVPRVRTVIDFLFKIVRSDRTSFLRELDDSMVNAPARQG